MQEATDLFTGSNREAEERARIEGLSDALLIIEANPEYGRYGTVDTVRIAEEVLLTRIIVENMTDEDGEMVEPIQHSMGWVGLRRYTPEERKKNPEVQILCDLLQDFDSVPTTAEIREMLPKIMLQGRIPLVQRMIKAKIREIDTAQLSE